MKVQAAPRVMISQPRLTKDQPLLTKGTSLRRAGMAWLSGKMLACGAEFGTARVRIMLPALYCLRE